MNPDPLMERVEKALDDLAEQGTKISITAVAAAAGIPRSTLYRHAQARALIHNRITPGNKSTKDLAAELARLGTLVDALAARVRNQEERLRQLEGRPHTTRR
jgi:AcrR family transcriptional regulator